MGGSIIARKALKLLPVLAGFGLLAAAAPADHPYDNPIADMCRADQHLAPEAGAAFAILPGMGDGGFKIRATPEAQAWFDYGIKLFHAFYHDDAKKAFDRAVAADPDCAMCLWGQALSRGSNQNFDAKPDSIAEGLAAAKKGRDKAQGPLETRLADIMIKRLEAKPTADAEAEYASAMADAASGEPGNIDLPLLAAEADLTTWRRGTRTGGARAEAAVAPILKAHPDNTAAIHYYIHATEMAGHPELALPYANRLAELAPGASHLVHMAAHTFFQVGLYQEAADVNARALAVDADHFRKLGVDAPLGTAFYYAHNQGFGEAGALMSGDAALAIRFADNLRKAEPAQAFDKGGLAGSEGRGFVIYGRYAPDRMLALADPGPDRAAAQVMYHYARGEAFAAKGDTAGVKREMAAISMASPQAGVARHVLEGRLAMLEKDYDAAAKAFRGAASLQGQAFITQMDPPPWWYPTRRSVAAAELAAGRYAQARSEAQASLSLWKGDPLALLVLARAEEKLGDRPAAARDLKAARRGWHGQPLAGFPVGMI